MTIYQNIERSKQLSDEVEAFLRSGGSVSSLERGYTAYPTGVLPPSKTKHVDAKRAEKEKAAKPKPVVKPKPVKPRPVKPKKENPRIADLIEQKSIVQGFMKQAKFGDAAILEKKAKLSSGSLSKIAKGEYLLSENKRKVLYSIIENFEFGTSVQISFFKPGGSNESYRRMMIKTMAEWAREKGEDNFQGKCQHHGWTEYKVSAKSTHCKLCRKTIEQNQVKVATQETRTYKLKLAREAAIAKGESTFVFHCKKCECDAVYKITKSGSQECLPCKKRRYREGRKPYEKRPFMTENLIRRNAAFDLGEKTFTGKCKKHGETVFLVQKNPSYKCRTCRTEQNRKSQVVNRERYMDHPRTIELLNFVNSQPKGIQRRLSEHMDISPATVNHYCNGRAILPDHHYSKFQEFKNEKA